MSKTILNEDSSKKERQPDENESASLIKDDQDEIIFEMTDFGMTIEEKSWFGKEKKIEILKHINASVLGGEILAIMGPSGAGKTSILECATLNQVSNAKLTGTVTIQNRTLTKKMFQEHCYIVQQRDYLPATLTCKETLIFAAKNCIVDEKRITAHVDELLQCLGLEECADVSVGDDLLPGLSGGQKRRLSVSLALVKMPKFLFLDEPTSGLDSASAFKTCDLIKKLVLRFKMATMLTIHQPNTKIYNLFNKLMLLHKGEVIYFGPGKEAVSWFSKMGQPLPANTNVADYLIDVLEDEKFHSQKKDFDLKALTRRLSETDRLSFIKPEILADLEKRTWPSMSRRIVSTMHQEGLIMVRNPILYTGRCVVCAVIGVFFALVYLKSRDRIQEQVIPKLWLIKWISVCPTSLACVQVLTHSMDIINLKRSVRNGIQHPLPFIFARVLQLPIFILFSVCSATIGGYFIGNWNPNKYFQLIFINALTMAKMEYVAEFLAVVTSNFLLGLMLFMGMWFGELLFNGVLVRDEEVIWPLRIACYLLPQRYGLQAMVYEEFIDSTFEGAERCNPLEDMGCKPEGYMCKTRACFGETGAEVLDSLHVHFDLLSSENTTAECVMYLLIFCVAIKVLYILRLYMILR